MLICIEGLDGTGKETQAKKILNKINQSAIYTSFPNYDSWSSDPIKHYLNGELSEDIPCEIIAEMFAIDFGITYQEKLKKHDDSNTYIICDRYVISSIIYQSADCETIDEKNNMIEFIKDLNYNRNKLPQPYKTILLDISYNTMMDNINKRMKIDPSHNDYNEGNADRMKKIYDNYQWLLSKYKNDNDYIIIKCDDENGKMRSIYDISDDIFNSIFNMKGDE